MSIYSFAGIVTGIILTLLITTAKPHLQRKKGMIHQDERTEAIKGRAATGAVWLTGSILFVGWVAENLWTYSQGGTIRFLNHWSITLLVLLTGYHGLYAYFYQQNSADEEDEVSIAEKRKIASTNLILALAMLTLALNASTPSQDPGLRYLLLLLSVVLAGSAAYTFLRTQKSSASR